MNKIVWKCLAFPFVFSDENGYRVYLKFVYRNLFFSFYLTVYRLGLEFLYKSSLIYNHSMRNNEFYYIFQSIKFNEYFVFTKYSGAFQQHNS